VPTCLLRSAVVKLRMGHGLPVTAVPS